jgi:uncharacterized protein (DUF58 family)
VIAQGAPRHVPRGVRPALAELVALRRYGAEMRRLLMLDAARRAGPRASAARSHGMDYAESRPYTPGDDARRIDWKITARSGRAHTKLFELERGRDLYAIIDQRAPMRFGTRSAFKSVVAAELGALAGWAAAEGGERFGALIAGGATIRCGMAEGSANALCEALAAGSGEDAAPLDRLAARAASESPPGTRFVVASDFAEAEGVLEGAVRVLRTKGEVLLVWVLDPLEARLPSGARYALTDGREHLLLDAGSAKVRAAQAKELSARRARLAHLGARPGTRCRAVRSGEELFAALERPFA